MTRAPQPATPPLAEPSAWRDLHLVVNGTALDLQVESRLLLSDLLRHRLGLTGTHVGCEQGSCGACTVRIDGAAVRSCLTLAASCAGREVTTVEALAADDEELHPVQRAFREHHAMQCGFCTPGFLMSLSDAQDQNESGSAEGDSAAEVLMDHLGGNLCRCTGYVGIRQAGREVLGLPCNETCGAAHTCADAAPGAPQIGRRLLRREDERLLRGHGRYVDDLDVPGVVEAAFLRSPVAHAHIRNIDTAEAVHQPGVIAVFTGHDLAGVVGDLLNSEELRVPPGIQQALQPDVRIQPQEALATDEVNYVGQPIAVVIAQNRYLAEDALEHIDVDFDELPVVIDPEAALRDDSPLALLSEKDNIGLHVRATTGDVDEAFANAAVVLKEEFRSHRYVPSPIETRAILARPDRSTDELHIFSNTQTPHRMRDHVAAAIGVSVDNVHLHPVDIGGGFGQKGLLVAEELVIPYVARELGVPVRWVEDRSENLVAGTHAREQLHRIELAADAQGHLLGLRDRFIVNLGCRNFVGLTVPYNSIAHVSGTYRIPAMDLEATGALTNTTFTTPFRGAGRPEVVFAMERAMDRLADKLGIDPWTLRERNLIRPEEMPYRNGLLDRRGLPHELDSGDYPAMMAMAREMIDLPAFRRRQEQLRAEGRYVGIGVAMYTEMSGLGPFESARATVQPSGRILVATGSPSMGQGHETSFAQVAADALGVPVELIDIVGGDTDKVPYGIGTIASRAMVTAGNAINKAATALRHNVIHAASQVMQVPVESIRFVSGVLVAGEDSLSLRDLVRRVAFMPDKEGIARLSELAYFQPPNYATSSGLHIAQVEVDEATGAVRFEDYVVIHEAGRIVNPVIVDGQIIGGTAQGIGGALLEHLQYDDSGQPVTTTFMDYLMPTVETVPDIRLGEIVCPSPTNELGVKGLGEGGAVGPPAAVANAVEDALRPFGVIVRSCPLTANHIRTLIRSAARE